MQIERENSMSYDYVFMGYGSTYVLKPMAEHFKSKNLGEVIEIDPYYDEHFMEKLNSIKRGECVFITSYHIFMDRYNYIQAGGTKDNESVSPLEIMEFIKPVKTIFYPHDLHAFMLLEEMAWCDLFDVILTPFINNSFYYFKSICPKVENIGWIKKDRTYFPNEKNYELSYKPIYLPSNLFPQIALYGVDGLARLWDRYIEKNIPIKLHENRDLEPLKKKLLELGFMILDEKNTVFDLLDDYNLFIGNGSSTVIYEAALSGKRVISILDGMEKNQDFIINYSRFKNIKILEYNQVSEFIKQLNEKECELPEQADILKPFDYESAFRLIVK